MGIRENLTDKGTMSSVKQRFLELADNSKMHKKPKYHTNVVIF
jgi:hypothetical protein